MRNMKMAGRFRFALFWKDLACKYAGDTALPHCEDDQRIVCNGNVSILIVRIETFFLSASGIARVKCKTISLYMPYAVLKRLTISQVVV